MRSDGAPLPDLAETVVLHRLGLVRSDGTFREDLHFAAGIAIAEAAGCVISDLAGDPLNAGRGLIVSADTATHQAVVALVAPHLSAVTKAA